MAPSKTRLTILRLLPLLVFLSAWEAFVRLYPKWEFYFGAPSEIAFYLFTKTVDGTLIVDTLTTLFETVAGFVLGNLGGLLIGVALWYSKSAFDIAKPYIIALGSAPVFALAPILIVWFGTGIFSKVMIAALSTVFVAMFQAYTGAGQVDERYTSLMRSFGASKWQVFRKVVAPAALVWVISAWRLNVGFALLGAFIGEFISSSQGLGHLILVAGGLFNISLVLCGVLLFTAIALLLNWVISFVEPHLQRSLVRWL